MGGHKSSTKVETKYVQRPLTEEEKALLRAEEEMARKLGYLAEKSEARSQELYNYYMHNFAPLEVSMIGRVLQTNRELGKVDKGLLSRYQAAALSGVYGSGKKATDKLKEFFAQRGLEGSGLEAKAVAALQSSVSQSAASALQQAFFQALEKSDLIRQQRLQNVGQAIAVGKGFSTGGFGYQGMAGQQYQGAGAVYSSTFGDWDKRWKQQSITNQKSSNGILGDLGNIFSFSKVL